MSPLAAAGEVLAVTVLAIGLAGFLQIYSRTRNWVHLGMMVTVVIVVGSSLIVFSDSSEGDANRAVLFLLMQSLGLPFLVHWGEQHRRRMEEIATTGEFEPGFPLPSTNHIMISFFGQIYEDLAKPIVALEGCQKLNLMLDRVSARSRVLAGSHFTPRGEFRLNEEAVLRIGGSKLDSEPFAGFLDRLVEHFAMAGDLVSRKDLGTALRANSGRTMRRFQDFLIDEGLFHNLARGLLTDRVSTGMRELDKALGGGLPQGVAVLLLANPSDERERITRAFIGAGMKNGEGCLVVSASRSPEQVRADLQTRATPGRFILVDCYTARLEEIPTLQIREDTIVSPVDPSVVGVAISRGLDSLKSESRRALVDMISAYAMSSPMDKIYPFILEMIHLLRGSNCTSLFVFNPPESEDQSDTLVLEELFDCVLKVRKDKDRNGQAVLDFEKMGSQLTPKAGAPEGSIFMGQRTSGPGTSVGIACEV